MGILEKYNQFVKRQDWDHLKFLQALLLIQIIIVLIFYIWVLFLANNELIPTEYIQLTIKDMTMGYLLGTISGLVVGFFILLPMYVKKNWNLHEVVPLFLIIDIFILIAANFVILIIQLSSILRVTLTIGFTIGSLITIIAYSGEVNKEHQEDIEN